MAGKSAVVAQASRSPRQAQLRRLLRGCEAIPLDEDTAHRVGRILAGSGTCDIIDGAVVAAAVDGSATVVTSDRTDIAHLVRSAGADLPIIDV